MASNAKDATVRDSEEGDGVSVSRLYREIMGDDEGVAFAAEQRSEAVVDSVTETLFDDGGFTFDDAIVKNNLDEILLLLVAMRDSETHGKGLMEDLAAVFDSRLSPGTVYPRLHDLEEEGVLRMQELVRTKEYRIDDEESTVELVESAMQQHLALGFFFYAALAEL